MGIYHYWKYVLIFSRGRTSNWRNTILLTVLMFSAELFSLMEDGCGILSSPRGFNRLIHKGRGSSFPVGALEYICQGFSKNTCCPFKTWLFQHQNKGTPPFTRQCSGVQRKDPCLGRVVLYCYWLPRSLSSWTSSFVGSEHFLSCSVAPFFPLLFGGCPTKMVFANKGSIFSRVTEQTEF